MRGAVPVHLALLAFGCQGAEERAGEGTFYPSYLQVVSARHSHLAIQFQVVDGRWDTPPRSIDLRSGGLSLMPPGMGGVTIVLRDRSDAEIGRYSIQDPLIVRSCDPTRKHWDGVKRILAEPVEILVPAVPTIAWVELIPDGEPPLRANVADQVARAFR